VVASDADVANELEITPIIPEPVPKNPTDELIEPVTKTGPFSLDVPATLIPAGNCASPTINIEPEKYDDVCAIVATDAVTVLFAQLLVPNSDPVIPRDTFNEPVSCVLPDTISPLRAINSFAIVF
jgi:hypothetical protein